MRARNIKPGIFRNEELGKLGPYYQILFEGLWCCADREGKLEDRPVRLKADIFPYYDLPKPIDEMLDDLFRSPGRFIIRYGVDGQNYIKILNFLEHQRPHNNENPSTIPDPPVQLRKKALSTKEESASNQGKKCVQPRKEPLRPDSLIPDSLIPDMPIPDALSTKVKSQEEQDKPEKRDNLGLKEKLAIGVPIESFDIFWDVYPRKVGKLDARRAWNKNKKPEIEKILEAIDRQKRSRGWKEEGGRFIPNPATWINQGRWDDEPTTETPQARAKCYQEAAPLARDEEIWTGPVPEEFKKVFEKIGRVD